MATRARKTKAEAEAVDPEEDEVEQDEDQQEVSFGVTEDADAEEEEEDADKKDENGDENDNEESKEDADNEGEGEDSGEKKEEETKRDIQDIVLQGAVVQEGKIAIITDFFLECTGGLRESKTIVRKIQDEIYEREKKVREAAREKEREERKRKREEREKANSEKKSKTDGDDKSSKKVDAGEAAESFKDLPIESFFSEDDELNDAKIVLVLLVPNENHIVGHIIGRAGVSVKAVKARSKCDVRVESDKYLERGTPDRRIALRGTVRQVAHAVQYILRLVEERSDDKEKAEMKYVVPDQAAGRLIGKQWATMRETEKAAGARIQVLGKTQLPAGVTGRVLQASGSYEAVAHAFYLCARLVVEKIDFPEIWIEGDPTKGDPRAGAMDRGPPPRERRERSYDREPERFVDRGPPPPQRRGDGGFSGGPGPGGYGGPPPMDGVTQKATTTEIEIPEGCVGFVFGRKGTQIREIRLRSGAGIESRKDPDLPGQRVLALSGSLRQVEEAMRMINDLVLEWGRRERGEAGGDRGSGGGGGGGGYQGPGGSYQGGGGSYQGGGGMGGGMGGGGMGGGMGGGGAPQYGAAYATGGGMGGGGMGAQAGMGSGGMMGGGMMGGGGGAMGGGGGYPMMR